MNIIKLMEKIFNTITTKTLKIKERVELFVRKERDIFLYSYSITGDVQQKIERSIYRDKLPASKTCVYQNRFYDFLIVIRTL